MNLTKMIKREKNIVEIFLSIFLSLILILLIIVPILRYHSLCMNPAYFRWNEAM